MFDIMHLNKLFREPKVEFTHRPQLKKTQFSGTNFFFQGTTFFTFLCIVEQKNVQSDSKVFEKNYFWKFTK